MNTISILAQNSTDDAGSVAAISVFALLGLGLLVLTLIGYWKMFTKMGLPGWMGIVPFVNIYMVFKARGQHEPVVFLILCLIPCIQIIGYWFLASDTAEVFDKEIGWKLFLFFLPGIAHIVLGFGASEAVPANIAPGVGINEQVL